MDLFFCVMYFVCNVAGNYELACVFCILVSLQYIKCNVQFIFASWTLVAIVFQRPISWLDRKHNRLCLPVRLDRDFP